MNWGVTYAVQELDDNDKILALLLRARRRGLNLSDDVARFIPYPRPADMQGLFDLLERLDAGVVGGAAEADHSFCSKPSCSGDTASPAGLV